MRRKIAKILALFQVLAAGVLLGAIIFGRAPAESWVNGFVACNVEQMINASAEADLIAAQIDGYQKTILETSQMFLSYSKSLRDVKTAIQNSSNILPTIESILKNCAVTADEGSTVLKKTSDVMLVLKYPKPEGWTKLQWTVPFEKEASDVQDISKEFHTWNTSLSNAADVLSSNGESLMSQLPAQCENTARLCETYSQELNQINSITLEESKHNLQTSAQVLRQTGSNVKSAAAGVVRCVWWLVCIAGVMLLANGILAFLIASEAGIKSR